MRTATILALVLACRGLLGAGEPGPQTNVRSRIGIFYSDTFLLHDAGAGHPESPARLQAIVKLLRENKIAPDLAWLEFAPADLAEIQAVHTPGYVKIVKDAVQSGQHRLPTGDTTICTNTWDAALLAAGAGIAAADAVMTGRVSSAFCFVRPPGHHATPTRGMGFCVFNNVAIAARHLQNKRGIQRILIADFDVHHGNGTQDTFYEDDTVFYFSTHQKGIYPGTGHEDETGKGKGQGFTLNVELPAGAGDAEALSAFRDKLKPAMEKFKPEFVLVSAGFDAYRNDPLGRLKYTEEGYAALARELVSIADAHARGRIVFMLEGGYNLEGLANSVLAILEVLKERKPAAREK